MVFLIQNSQNRDSAAIQVKLDELIRVSTAHNSFVGIEHLTDEELEDIRSKCERRAEAEKGGDGGGEAHRQTKPRRPRTAPWRRNEDRVAARLTEITNGESQDSRCDGRIARPRERELSTSPQARDVPFRQNDMCGRRQIELQFVPGTNIPAAH